MKEKWLVAFRVLSGLQSLPENSPAWMAYVGLPLWWTFLVLIAIAFAGSSTKFVYLDF